MVMYRTCTIYFRDGRAEVLEGEGVVAIIEGGILRVQIVDCYSSSFAPVEEHCYPIELISSYWLGMQRI